MPDFIDFLPLFAEEDEATIHDRWVVWANEGLDPVQDADSWTDVATGSFWDILSTSAIREDARIYDRMGTEVVAAAIPATSWGDYLTLWGSVLGEDRLPATRADGEVTFTGTSGTVVPAGTTVSAPAPDPDSNPIEFQTTVSGTLASGTLTVPVVAAIEGSRSNLASNAILDVAVNGVTAVTNVDPLVGGTDEQSDPALKAKIEERFEGAAAANQRYYKRLALAHAGVGRAIVVPVASGPGTISVVVATESGGAVAGSVVTDLQAQLDPVSGQGLGDGQTGAAITVSTIANLLLTVVANISTESGYSFDGAGGTLPVRQAVTDAIEAYLLTVDSGELVVFYKVAAAIVDVDGVSDIVTLTINGGTANIAVPGAPPQLPVLDVLTLS